LVIEQAIFTSTETDRAVGYQLAATSPGIDAVDLHELRVWGPSHDSLVNSGNDALSVNFHPLPSGAFCVSKTTPAGSEYSGRSGQLIYTQCLVVPPEALSRFSNNPFALLKAAFAQGSLCVHGQLPKQLAPFRLGGRAAAVDLALLGQLAAEPGPRWLGAMVEGAIASTSLVLLAGRGRERLIAGLINALPVECRTTISFSTGLKPSPRRPFRLMGLADAAGDAGHSLRFPNVKVIELSEGRPQPSVVEGSWGSLVAGMLENNRLAYFSAQLAYARPGLQVDDLAALAEELWARMPARARPAADARVAEASPPEAISRPTVRDDEISAQRRDATGESVDDGPEVRPQADQRRADAAHPRLWRAAAEAATPTAAEPQAANSSPTATTDSQSDSPSHALSWQCPEVVEKLELLDDLVFEAIAGKPSALGQLRALWPTVLAEIPRELLDESRGHYIRHALRVWQDCVDGDQIRNPALAVTAMDVVCLLFEG
jgi:GTPase-associated protein 1, N-terminal domain type 2